MTATPLVLYLAGKRTAINISMGMHDDKDYWTNLQWPAAPNTDDYAVFSSYCTGRVLLLGSTKLLLPLCEEAWDIEPKYNNAKIKNRNWLSIDSHWDLVQHQSCRRPACYDNSHILLFLPVVVR